jgi:hypothetical protein
MQAFVCVMLRIVCVMLRIVCVMLRIVYVLCCALYMCYVAHCVCVMLRIVYAASLSALCFIALKHANCTTRHYCSFMHVTIDRRKWAIKSHYIPFLPRQNRILAVHCGKILD